MKRACDREYIRRDIEKKIFDLVELVTAKKIREQETAMRKIATIEGMMCVAMYVDAVSDMEYIVVPGVLYKFVDRAFQK